MNRFLLDINDKTVLEIDNQYLIKLQRFSERNCNAKIAKNNELYLQFRILNGNYSIIGHSP